MDKELLARIISGGLYAFLIFLCCTPVGGQWLAAAGIPVSPAYLYFGLMTLLLVGGLWEYTQITKLRSPLWLGALILVSAFIYYRFSFQYFHQYFFFGLKTMDLMGLLLLVLGLVTLFKYPFELQYGNGKAIFGVVYLAIPFGFALGLPTFFDTQSLYFTAEPFWLFVLIWASDTLAFFTGKRFGKHKLAPKISPKKTWEGLYGGAAATLIGGLLIEFLIPELKGNWILIGVLVAVFAPLGDLAESQLKRIFKVKDSSKIIPGHGGILDRLDSFILCGTVVYLYFMILIKFAS